MYPIYLIEYQIIAHSKHFCRHSVEKLVFSVFFVKIATFSQYMVQISLTASFFPCGTNYSYVKHL